MKGATAPMGNMTPVTSTTHGVTTQENADTFAKLDAAREAGTLANTPEMDNSEQKKLVLSFQEKTAEELEGLTKAKLIEYMQEWHVHKDAIAEQMAEHAAALAERAAIHGIPRRKNGTVIPQLLEGNPNHPGSGIPYALEDEDGMPRMSKGTKKRKPTAITRTDN